MKPRNLICLCFAFGLMACQRSQPSPASFAQSPAITSATPANQPSSVSYTDAAAAPSLEYKLASLNKGGSVMKDDPTVIRFHDLLTSLEKKTVNSKQQIGDMTLKAQQIAKTKYGKEVKLLDLMEGANRSIPDEIDHIMRYEEVITIVMQAYVR